LFEVEQIWYSYQGRFVVQWNRKVTQHLLSFYATRHKHL